MSSGDSGDCCPGDIDLLGQFCISQAHLFQYSQWTDGQLPFRFSLENLKGHLTGLSW